MLGTVGLPELLVVLALVLIVFGAGKLPQVMASMGQGVREFRKASEGDLDDDSAAAADDKKADPAAAEAATETPEAKPADATEAKAD